MREYGKLGIRLQKGTGKFIGYMYYYDEQGERKQITHTAKSLKKREAEKELRTWELEQRRKADLEQISVDGGLTVEEVVTNFLDEQLSKGFLEKSTHYAQTSTCRKNLFPYIGNRAFVEVDNITVESWLTMLAESGLKQSTIHSIYAILNKTYAHYQFIKQISDNPCSHVQKPKKGAKRTTFLDADQMENLLGCLNAEYEYGSYFWTAINLAVLGGLRRGEICGLRFHDVDMKRNIMHIETAIGITGTGTYTKDPKNESSKRAFNMTKQLVEVIQARIDYVKKEYGSIDGSWFVIGDTIHYKPPTTIAKEVTSFVRRNRIVDHYGAEVTLHSLRHNAATLAIKNNVDVASLSHMLGHASKAITLDTYSHVDPEAMRLAADRMTDAFQYESSAYEIWERREESKDSQTT